MLDAAALEGLGWHIKSYEPEMYLFTHHAQIVQLEWRRDISPTTSGAAPPTRGSEHRAP